MVVSVGGWASPNESQLARGAMFSEWLRIHHVQCQVPAASCASRCPMQTADVLHEQEIGSHTKPSSLKLRHGVERLKSCQTFNRILLQASHFYVISYFHLFDNTLHPAIQACMLCRKHLKPLGKQTPLPVDPSRLLLDHRGNTRSGNDCELTGLISPLR